MADRVYHQPLVATFIVTAVAVAVSVLITQATMWAVGYDAGILPAALAGFIPTVMVPLTIYPLARANQRLRRVRGELERLAHTDVLTGLPNRRAFFEQAEQMLNVPSLAAEPIAALMIDVDHFKAINDTHGHGAGDHILRAVAAAIRGAVADTRPTAWTVARIGGEEFAALVQGLAALDLQRLAERICATVRGLCSPFPAGSGVTISAGLALRAGDENIDALLRSADDAVYLAKQAGRDRWAFATPATKSAPVAHGPSA
ncbi:MAG TPA: GGDEF domain-containing protein [Bauldia sp.]|nr:GGDEF domain-containing protein [Bauldia sp.]